MSNVSVLLKNRSTNISSGISLERGQERELAVEEYLRLLVARVPNFKVRFGRLRGFVSRTNAHELKMRGMSDIDLAKEFALACIAMRKSGFTDKLLSQAFAAVREASSRTLGMRHHDVQLIGGWAILQGMIAEMETGEGKTLVATLAACTAAAAGAAVHVITVNDYLAERDAAINSPLYEFFGLRVAVIAQGMTPDQRREKYLADVVYVSNKEVVFDYLKDRISAGESSLAHYRLRQLYKSGRQANVIMRGLHVAIVDEADSILIDEARTPLIISETVDDEYGVKLYNASLSVAAKLINGEHFKINQHREVWLTTKGEQYLRELMGHNPGVWSSSLWRNELVQKALVALHCYHRDQHYIVNEGTVQIVDEFTGRVMPDRAWESGLHQMIEAKEGCDITGRRKTLSKMTYQRFMRRYLLLGGMTGTATEVVPELRRVYDLQVLRIPTNLPIARKRLPNRCWVSADERWRAVAMRAQDLSASGSAVLIGTRSVEASETLSSHLRQYGVEHSILNARNDKEEAAIVEQAGGTGRITIATNMAGRGTDIKPDAVVLGKGGLHVILTEFHETARVDRQLFGRSARQGQPGTVEAMVSLDDEIFRYVRRSHAVVRALTMSSGKVPRWLLNPLVRYAQFIAQRHSAGIRISTLKQDKKLQDSLAFSGESN